MLVPAKYHDRRLKYAILYLIILFTGVLGTWSCYKQHNISISPHPGCDTLRHGTQYRNHAYSKQILLILPFT